MMYSSRVSVSRRSTGLALVLLLLSACTDRRPASSAATAGEAVPSLRLVLMTDLAGYLEPCGCQSRPLGGVDRLANKLRALDHEGVPRGLLLAGSLFFGADAAHAPVAEDADVQSLWQAQTLADIVGRLGLTALAAGNADRAQTAEVRSDLRRRTGGVWLGPDGPAPGEPPPAEGLPTERGTLQQIGGIPVGLLGLHVPSEASDEALAQVRLGMQAQVQALRERGARVVVALVDAERRATRRALREIEGLDFVVQGGLDEAEPAAPAQVGSTVFLQAGRHGQGVVVLDVFLSKEPRDIAHAATQWQDLSEWTRRVERDALRRRIEELVTRIADWEQDPTVDREQLAQQRAHLASLRQQAKNDTLPRMSAQAFRADWIELGPEVPRDPAVAALMQAHDRRVNVHNREALAHLKPLPVPSGMAHYLGAEACGSCHAEALAWWRTHPHGRAYDTLVTRHKQYNLSCVGCHVTGYQQPGGATATHHVGLTDVGCESCHGPGSLHVDAPSESGLIARQVPETVCVQCHNPEHSDRFHFGTYSAMLMAPGHGRPMSDGRRVLGQTESK